MLNLNKTHIKFFWRFAFHFIFRGMAESLPAAIVKERRKNLQVC